MKSEKPSALGLRLPSWKRIIAYIVIITIIAIAAAVPARKVLYRIDRPMWESPEMGVDSGDLSAAVLWLAMANISSFIVVWLLWRDLRSVTKAAQGLHFKRIEGVESKIPARIENDGITNYILSSLGLITTISIVVLLITFFICLNLFTRGGELSESTILGTVYWTGGIYVLAMTCCDLAARRSYRLLCTVELVIPTGDNLGEGYALHAKNAHAELLETLGDFDRMIFYVDVPVLIGVGIILCHKSIVLSTGSYYLGFIAGAVAMHTILANIISLSIAASSTISEK